VRHRPAEAGSAWIVTAGIDQEQIDACADKWRHEIQSAGQISSFECEALGLRKIRKRGANTCGHGNAAREKR